jgi:hypothetical protein
VREASYEKESGLKTRVKNKEENERTGLLTFESAYEKSIITSAGA